MTYDNLSRGFAWAVKWGPFERGDMLDADRLEEVIAAHRPDAVMHFAAFAYVGESVPIPAIYYRNNVVGTLGLLDAMRAARRRPASSSPAPAPPMARGTCRADHRGRAAGAGQSLRRARSGWSSRSLRDYAPAYGLRAVALRYFNAAGADPDGEIGEDHDPETHLIPLLLDAAAQGAPFTIYGDDYATPDGTCVRDYVHVSDLADAHVLALASLERAPGFAAYNLGTGRGLLDPRDHRRRQPPAAPAAIEVERRPAPPRRPRRHHRGRRPWPSASWAGRRGSAAWTTSSTPPGAGACAASTAPPRAWSRCPEREAAPCAA